MTTDNLFFDSFQSMGMIVFEWVLSHSGFTSYDNFAQEKLFLTKSFRCDNSHYAIVVKGKPMSFDVELSCFPIFLGDNLWRDDDCKYAEPNLELVKLIADLNDESEYDCAYGKFSIDPKSAWRYDLELRLDRPPSFKYIRWAIWRVFVALICNRRELDAVAFRGATLETCEPDDGGASANESLVFLKDLSRRLGDSFLFSKELDRKFDVGGTNDGDSSLDAIEEYLSEFNIDINTDAGKSAGEDDAFKLRPEASVDGATKDENDLRTNSKKGYDGFGADGDGTSSGYDGFLGKGELDLDGYDGFLYPNDEEENETGIFNCFEEDREKEDDEDSEEGSNGLSAGDSMALEDIHKRFHALIEALKALLNSRKGKGDGWATDIGEDGDGNKKKNQEEYDERRAENECADGKHVGEERNENEREEDDESEDDG